MYMAICYPSDFFLKAQLAIKYKKQQHGNITAIRRNGKNFFFFFLK